MKLSVVIVNYNVKYFLEQCLLSVRRAAEGMDAEIFVVDNNSVDGSVEMMNEKFPDVIVIANRENKGFSFANNQAIRRAKGAYVLLLNPDTLVQEDTFHRSVRFMDDHPLAGGLGVKMLDGKGRFLPESKRGFPSPAVAFYKIVGLSALLPKSKIFGRYHLGFLDNDHVHEVDVLSGAFMLLRKSVLDQVGLLDESFFMYGEDIDLSYRIVNAGYKNYYFPETRIIHYKGESTKKSSINYVFVFYNAMIIFARKHFTHGHARMFIFLINLAIYARASLAILSRFLKRISLPLADALAVVAGIYLIKNYWTTRIMHVHYPDELLYMATSAYVGIWLISVYFSGGYDFPVKISKILRGVFAGTIGILVIYALMPESYRFSRAIILLGAAWTFTALLIIRYFLSLLSGRDFKIGTGQNIRLLIVGGREEARRVLSLMKLSDFTTSFVGFVKPDPLANGNGSPAEKGAYLGDTRQLKEIANVYQADEIIFCARDIASREIINLMSRTGDNLEYKIAPPESLYIIGSSSVNSPGELYVIGINAISKSINRRSKRLLDLAVALAAFILFPLVFPFIKHPAGLLINLFYVLGGKKSWVGYIPQPSTSGKSDLPWIRPGILTPADRMSSLPDESTAEKLNQLYAKDYRVTNDLGILWKCYRLMGRAAPSSRPG